MKKIMVAFANLLYASLLFIGCQNGSTDNSSTKELPTKAEFTSNSVCPEFSPIGGFYKEAQKVSIACADTDKIYYTVLKKTFDENGNWDETAWKESVSNSKPTETSTLYEGEFEISEDCIIRAMAVKNDGTKRYAMTCFDFDLARDTDYTGTQLESPNWQDQVIYFILTDRFYNGNKSNDKIEGLKDQNGKLYDESITLPGQPVSGYQGGDLKGVTEKLQYIKNLGCTAIWITPPVKCQVAEENYHGFHGYWASDFTEVDPHMGTLQEYQELVDEAHKLGLYVIQDIVVNHTGDYQKITKDVEMTADMLKAGTTSDFVLNSYSVPFDHPEQLPWALNNITDLTVDEFTNNAFYHYNSKISDFSKGSQRYTWQSSDLDDIATDNAVVRNLLRGYFRYWMDKAGIDGYRIDTVMYVEEDFFNGFINSTEDGNLGIRPYAASLGKNDFINFGEAWSNDEELVAGYTHDTQGNDRMDSMIYFPMRNAIVDTISGGKRTDSITKIIENRYKQGYKNPDKLVTFIDNHDTARWGQTMLGSNELIKAAYGIIFTMPGVPQIYYGSEQGFDGESRACMFEGGFLTEGKKQTEDQFDETSEWYKYFQNLIKMRKDNPVFRYNTITVLEDTQEGAGIFSYIIRGKDENGGYLQGKKSKAIFVMNTSSVDRMMSGENKFLKSGDKFSLLSDVSACPSGSSFDKTLTITNKNGKLNFVVPKNSYAIYILDSTNEAYSESSTSLTLDTVPTEEIKEEMPIIKGTCSVDGTVYIVLNGDYTHKVPVNAEAGKQFSEQVDITYLSSGIISIQLIYENGDNLVLSNTKSIVYNKPYKLLKSACVTDPAKDDFGVGQAKGFVQIPTEESFRGKKKKNTTTGEFYYEPEYHHMDILGVDVYTAGTDIRIGVKMNSLSKNWNPTSYLFDHVIFHIFISDGDDTTGCEYHPGYNYKLPSAFGKWDFVYQCNGWGNAYYSAEGATEEKMGKSYSPAPSNVPEVNYEGLELTSGMTLLDWSDYTAPEDWEDLPGMIWFTIPAGALDFPASLDGYKIYINTYDYDMGNPRGMIEGNPETWKFSTGFELDENGKRIPIEVEKQKVDADGKPVVDDEGKPVLEKVIVDKPRKLEDTPRVIDELDTIIQF